MLIVESAKHAIVFMRRYRLDTGGGDVYLSSPLVDPSGAGRGVLE